MSTPNEPSDRDSGDRRDSGTRDPGGQDFRDADRPSRERDPRGGRGYGTSGSRDSGGSPRDQRSTDSRDSGGSSGGRGYSGGSGGRDSGGRGYDSGRGASDGGSRDSRGGYSGGSGGSSAGGRSYGTGAGGRDGGYGSGAAGRGGGYGSGGERGGYGGGAGGRGGDYRGGSGGGRDGGRGRPDFGGRGRDGQRPTGRGDSRPRGGRPFEDPARMIAYQALLAVHRDEAYANLILPNLLREGGVIGRDAAFATELTYGTLRTRGSIDAIIAAAAGREVGRIDPPARDALRLGVYQLLHTRVPAHAAVASTVDMVRAVAPGAVGFANAVLRRVTENDLETWLAEVAPSESDDPVGHLAIVENHPEWIVRAFRDALGGDMEETRKALAANNERPEVHLCARPGRIEADELADAVDGTPGAFSPLAVYLGSGAPGDLPAIQQGKAHVQDEGSQLVALALLEAAVEGRDESWLDLCAGPGGKAGLLAAVAAQRGAHLTAVEVTPHRADMVAHAVRGFPATVICADGRTAGESHELPEAGFDRVLVDAPCTGLGSLRRRPESRWRRQPSDLPPLTKLQRELLAAALKAVRPGGIVAYVTCSPHLVETRLTVEVALGRGKQAELIDAREVLPRGMPGLGEGPMVQLWPHRHGTDAMFLALIRRLA